MDISVKKLREALASLPDEAILSLPGVITVKTALQLGTPAPEVKPTEKPQAPKLAAVLLSAGVTDHELEELLRKAKSAWTTTAKIVDDIPMGLFSLKPSCNNKLLSCYGVQRTNEIIAEYLTRNLELWKI